MIRISRTEKEELDRLGLLRYKKNGFDPVEQNFVVANRTHKSRNKTYYVVFKNGETIYFFSVAILDRLLPLEDMNIRGTIMIKTVHQIDF